MTRRLDIKFANINVLFLATFSEPILGFVRTKNVKKNSHLPFWTGVFRKTYSFFTFWYDVLPPPPFVFGIHISQLVYGLRHAKTSLRAYADSKGPDQPAHLYRLIRALSVCLKNHWILKNVWVESKYPDEAWRMRRMIWIWTFSECARVHVCLAWYILCLWRWCTFSFFCVATAKYKWIYPENTTITMDTFPEAPKGEMRNK